MRFPSVKQYLAEYFASTMKRIAHKLNQNVEILQAYTQAIKANNGEDISKNVKILHKAAMSILQCSKLIDVS